MYDSAKTEVSKGALVQLALALNAYRKDIVLAGGWAPYFLTLGHFEHCGSLDIDLALRPSIMIRYERIREIVEALGYKPTDMKFKFQRHLKDRKGAPFRIELDFLTEPQAAIDAGLVKVQDGLLATLIPGCNVAFDFYYEQRVEGIIPGDDEAVEIIRVADVVGSLTMKGLALGRPAKLDKDSYDIYAVAGFHGSSPTQAADKFKRSISEKTNGRIPDSVATALNRIYNGFDTPNSYASQAVSRFMMSDVSLDAQERIKAFRAKVREQ